MSACRRSVWRLFSSTVSDLQKAALRNRVLTTRENLEIPGNLLIVEIQGKLRNFKIYSGKWCCHKWWLCYSMCCLSICDITVCQHFWRQPCCYTTLGLSLGHRVESIIVSDSCIIWFGDRVTGMDGASQSPCSLNKIQWVTLTFDFAFR